MDETQQEMRKKVGEARIEAAKRRVRDVELKLLEKREGAVAGGVNADRPMDDHPKALMDYTKFHIGLYTTLCTLLVAVVGL